MKRVLVVNPFGIGDVIFSMTLVEGLRGAFSGAHIGFFCNERTVELVRMNPSIDQTFVFNRDHFRRLWAESRRLCLREIRGLLARVREEKFDTLLDLSLGREFNFFAWLAGIRKRVGLDYRWRGLFLTDRIKIKGYETEPVAETQLRLLEKLGVRGFEASGRLPIHCSDAARREAAEWLKKNGVLPDAEVVAIAPGGGKSWGPNAVFKQWDPERFAEAAKRLAENPRVRIVLIGDAEEGILLEKAAAGLGGKAAIVSGEPFERVVAVLLRSRVLLCNDGGLLHLANALGVRTVSIFGPVDEKVYGPYVPPAPHRTLTSPVPCRPCYRRFHFPPCPHERRCLTGISVEEVLGAVKEVT